MSAEIDLLLAVVDRAYDRASWHGVNLKGSLRGVTPDVAAWRPGTGSCGPPSGRCPR